MKTIISLLRQIDNDEIVLPAIQRNFVWSVRKIERLMDSILRGYPVGIVLMWETYNDIQHRHFEKIYKESTARDFHDNQKKRKLTLVLDGQQRLQSLYIALFGQYNGQFLYFDVLSGRHSDDFEEEKYSFNFMSESRAKQINENAKSSNGEEEKRCFHKVHDLFEMKPEEKQRYKRSLAQRLDLTEDDSLRLDVNLAKIDDVLTKDLNILKESIIDEHKPAKDASRQTESDVLEIFVRVNRQGTLLSRSDLIFSMLKLNWRESATTLPDFVDQTNSGNSFSLDIDFVVRCLFAVSDLGTKFDIDLLRKSSNLEKMQSNFDKCCSAIQSTVDYVQQHCWLSDSRVFGSTLYLVPFVYYLFHLDKHQVPKDQIVNCRKAFFLFCFSGVFSRYAESRIGKFIKEELLPLQKSNDPSFPFAQAKEWTVYWSKETGDFDASLVQGNSRLALHIVQQRSQGNAKHNLNTWEMDHIFPISVLREKGFDEAEIHHFANFWMLEKGKNISKSNQNPKQWLKDVPDSELGKALIDRDLLEYRRYRNFLKTREKKILEALAKKIGFDK